MSKTEYDTEIEMDVRHWIEAVLGIKLDASVADDEPLGQTKMHEVLKNGVILCKLAQAVIGPSSCKYKDSGMPFVQMENIGNFLTACEGYGIARTDIFQTVDVYEGSNMRAVLNGICSFGRKAQSKGFQGPTLGPKEATANKREFSEEDLASGKSVIGLQMGTNKGASQSGDHFGRPRQVSQDY